MGLIVRDAHPSKRRDPPVRLPRGPSKTRDRLLQPQIVLAEDALRIAFTAQPVDLPEPLGPPSSVRPGSAVVRRPSESRLKNAKNQPVCGIERPVMNC